MKKTFHVSKKRRKTKHGFRKRKLTRSGCKVLIRRRRKGRKRLVPV